MGTDNQWAGMSGVSMGDQLIAVNGDLCQEMTTDAFKKHMSGRPVICTFRNPAAPAGGKEEAKPAKPSKAEASTPKKDDKEKEKEKESRKEKQSESPKKDNNAKKDDEAKKE